MIPDAHTPCPVCAQAIRDHYAASRRALIRLQDSGAPEYEDLYHYCEEMRPWIEAHYANQEHAFSKELAAAREPQLQEPQLLDARAHCGDGDSAAREAKAL